MNNITTYKIIENLKQLRKNFNLTQADLAKKLNLSFQQISNLENGRRNLTLEQALLLNQIFGVSVDWILGISSIPQNINTEAVSKALIVRINDIYEQTHKWKQSAPDKPEAKQEILDLCEAYRKINKNRTSKLEKILEIQKTVELWWYLKQKISMID